MPLSHVLAMLLHSLLIVAEGRHWLDVNLCNGPSTSTLASSLDARRVKAAVERRKVLPVAYVQFRGMNTRLKDAILLTMSWGNEVVLLSDVPVVSTNSSFGPALARRFHYFPIDYTGCEEYQSAYNALHEQHPHLFANYPREAELWNEVRYLVLYNFVMALSLDEIVYLDSDVVLLVPARTAFDRTTYGGCDAVYTFNQISSRIKPVAAPELEAFWAGTSLLSRAALQNYSAFTLQIMKDPVFVSLLLGKMRSLPTINDMATWCLFALFNRSPATVTPALRSALLSSDMAASFRDRLTMCNTQPFTWEPGSSSSGGSRAGVHGASRADSLVKPAGPHGLIHSASGELKQDMIVRSGRSFYVHGSSYMRNFCATWPDQIQWINASAILAGGWWRVYSVHKLYSEMSTGGTAFYHADTHFIGSSAQFQNVYPMMNTKASGAAPLRRYPLDLGLPAGDTSFRPFSAHSCKPP